MINVIFFKLLKPLIFFALLIYWEIPVSEIEKPETPRIDCVIPLPLQAHATSSNVIWYDDFNGQSKVYAEGGNLLDELESFGKSGKSMLCFYKKGEQGTGGGKVFFGDSPAYADKMVRKGESFDEIYWRIYVKHQYGWEGAPAKMSRATSIVNAQWAQAMIAHFWSGTGSSLTLDPVCGVQEGKVVTRRYNDFEKMKWLGNKPVSKFPIHATEESGYWVLVECRVKLNTPGKSDGLNQLWIDGRLECERKNLDFRGNYSEFGINAVFLEAYWNDGSPKTQSRWYDNFVISTQPIGPVICPANPKIIKTPFHGDGTPRNWQFEVASDYNGENIVYKSTLLPPKNSSEINISNGVFVGHLKGNKKLESGNVYYIRVRQSNQKGDFSDWSRWHQGFGVE